MCLCATSLACAVGKRDLWTRPPWPSRAPLLHTSRPPSPTTPTRGSLPRRLRFSYGVVECGLSPHSSCQCSNHGRRSCSVRPPFRSRLVSCSQYINHPVTIFAVLFLLVCSGIVMYFPQHLAVMQRRAIYYLWGQEGGERALWQWLGLGTGLHKEL